jgi:hypothetical protein
VDLEKVSQQSVELFKTIMNFDKMFGKYLPILKNLTIVFTGKACIIQWLNLDYWQNE